MQTDSLLGVWAGTVHNTNGWDMKITISILQPVEIGSMLGVFDIPMIPCSGALRIVNIRGETLELQAEKLQGDCGKADSDSLELLPDGTLLYVSKGRDWETRGIIQRVFDESMK
ncbi:MAG: hypothetical protein EHM33_29215 [Chloroflexi bacterium]|nr:MAG: hypothetical protein EHM33_29215 [Chloroflexota bacterium]